MAAQPKLGSEEWVEAVFKAPAVDSIKGRTRHTQAHSPYSRELGRAVPVQGRLEFLTWTALQYLTRIGLVARAKAHPFATSTADLGWETRPDFFAVTTRGINFVIETKTARYVTRAVESELDANAKAFSRINMKYVVWTDRYPLSRAVRHNFLRMRRHSGEEVEKDEIDALCARLQGRTSVSLGELMGEDFDMACVFAAWWRGRVYLPLNETPCFNSAVSIDPAQDLEQMFFRGQTLSDDWWGSLANA